MGIRSAASLLVLFMAVALAAGLGHAAPTGSPPEPQARTKHYDPLP